MRAYELVGLVMGALGGALFAVGVASLAAALATSCGELPVKGNPRPCAIEVAP